MAEVQALVCDTPLELPRRATSGLDSARVGDGAGGAGAAGRVAIGKQRRLRGHRRRGPADRAVRRPGAGARDGQRRSPTPLPADLVAIGEVGLAGEVRRVAGVQRRLAEAARLGFRRALVPPGSDFVPPGGAARADVREAGGHPPRRSRWPWAGDG